MADEVGWGLAAGAGSGKTFVDVTQSGGKVEKWQLLLQFPSIQMWMEIQNSNVVVELSDFFKKTYGSQITQGMTLGFYFGLPVTVVKDAEFADRYFIWVEGKDIYDGRSDYLQIALYGERTTDFMASLAKVVDDLKN